ncbi:MAG: monooxygenase [Pseudonocardiaceae bacterium]|nr:monooxygenase [Pseudonocardiaceae bacterium]
MRGVFFSVGDVDNTPMPDVEVPVLIVGGSMVGLSTALFLAQHGIESLIVERHDGTAIHPRAGHFHLRTLELLRSVGLEQAVRTTSEERFFPNGGINAVETLAGGEMISYIPDLNDGVAEFSPSRRLFVAQHALEPLLRHRAEELGATLRYATEAMSVDQDDDGVTAGIRDCATGAQRTVRARYLVAADGNRSPIRQRLGIGMRGYGVLSNSATIYFRADCRALLQGSDLGVIYVFNDAVRGFFRFEKSGTSGFLAVNTLGDPTRPGALDVTDGLTTQRAADLVRAAIGVPDMPVDVEDVAHWQATADVAERYQHGRVFLVGDAAHALPPNGGYGGNTGIQDAHNLAWKLAMVIRGTAGDELLASYDAERRPVGELTIEQAYTRYARRVTPELAPEDLPPLVDDFSMEIGYRYHSPAVLPDPGAVQNGAVVGHPRSSGGAPGTRAPHVALRAEGQPASTLDLLGDGVVVLAGPDGQAWCEAARSAGSQLGVPIRAHTVGIDVEDPQRSFGPAYGVCDSGAVVVRPDGFVGWRSRNGTTDPEQALLGALRTLLSTPDRLEMA